MLSRFDEVVSVLPDNSLSSASRSLISSSPISAPAFEELFFYLSFIKSSIPPPKLTDGFGRLALLARSILILSLEFTDALSPPVLFNVITGVSLPNSVISITSAILLKDIGLILND